MTKEIYNVVVVGAGPGGYAAAIRAGQLGIRTAIIEKEELGGVCLNWGCIPTKSLLHAAHLYNSISNAKKFGISASNVKLDLKKLILHNIGIQKKLRSGIKHLLEKNNVDIIKGRAKLVKSDTIEVKGKKITGEKIILATGSTSRALPNLKIDHKFITTAKDVVIKDKTAKNLLIIGSGAIGIEFADFYNSIGSKVTIFEIQDRILPLEDHEISETLEQHFIKSGITIKTKASLVNTKVENKKITVEYIYEDKKSRSVFDQIICAVGITPNTQDLGLENTLVKTNAQGFIQKCPYTHLTDDESIYAIGDITNPPHLAHKATMEGIQAVESINKNNNEKLFSIPSCIYSKPQIASIGMTEYQLQQKQINFKVGKFSLKSSGKAMCIGEDYGFCKVIFDSETGELLGAHMIGPEVTELIHSLAIIKEFEIPNDELRAVFPHPTISEGIQEAILDSLGKAIHK